MSILSPLNINLIDLKNIKTIKTKIINNNKIIFLKYNNINFVIQLSNLSINNINNSSIIELNINNDNIISFFNKLDNYIIKLAKNNSYNWFNGSNSINYKSILNENSTIKLKLCNNENLKTILSFNENQITNFLDLTNFINVKCKLILEIYAIQIKSNIFNLILRPINIAFTQYNLYNYKFLEDDDINDDDINDDDINDDDINDDDDININDDNDDDSNDVNKSSYKNNYTNCELSENDLFIKNILNNSDISITTSTNSQNL